MLKLNPFRRNRTLGLDVGSHSIKWAVVDSSRREILEMGTQPLFPERTRFHQVMPEDLWQQRVVQALQQIPGEVTDIITVLQGRTTACGYLEFSLLPEQELRVAVQAEAQQWIPFTTEATQFSFSYIPAVTRAAATGIFYAAALRAQVDRLQGALQQAELIPDRMEIPALALAREFALNHSPPKEKFYGLVHVGFSLSHFVVVRDGYPYFARDFSPGASHFIYALQAQEGCSWNEAQQRLQSADFRHWSLLPPLLRLGEALRRTLEFSGAQLDGVFLSGGIAGLSLSTALSQAFGGVVELDDWTGLRDHVGVSPASPYKLAVGLAVS